ncbi:MAG TPA: multiubiquitin domain-containing protein [Flavobacteriales bacterium]|nr:multiubiquitin domain-containing protein [Flavobacteriales bacterium]
MKKTITLNGNEIEVEASELSYEQIVQLAYPGSASDRVMTMTYDRRVRDGSLKRGERLTLDEGLIINVHDTSGA